MGQRLQGQVAIITGASRGIGRAIAEAYAAEGASLCLIATNADRLAEVAASLRLGSERLLTIGVDVRDRAASFQAVAQAEQHFGRVDVLVNNAGGYRAKAFLDYTDEDFRDMLDINLMGTLHFMQAALARVPLGRMLDPGEIAQLAVYLGSHESRGMTGQSILLDGGMVLV